MESVAAARTRLHFQSFGMTGGLHDRKTNAQLLSVEQNGSYNWKMGVSKKKGHALRLHTCKCDSKRNFSGFIVLFQ